MNSNSGSHQPPVSLSRAGGGSIASAGDYTWGWSAWVLENYSLYISILAAFTKKVINMPFKVPFAIDSQNAGSHNRDGTGLQWLSDMGTGRASVELLWRVTSVFDEELVRLLARCQVSRRFLMCIGWIRTRAFGRRLTGLASKELNSFFSRVMWRGSLLSSLCRDT